MHLTRFCTEHSGQPTGFTQRLRRHLRARRLRSIRQLGADRIAVFEFETSSGALFLVTEFFAAGNFILCDSAMKIIALARRVSGEDAAWGKIAVDERYSAECARPLAIPSTELLKERLASGSAQQLLRTLLTRELGFGSALAMHCIEALHLRSDIRVCDFLLLERTPALADHIRRVLEAFFVSPRLSAFICNDTHGTVSEYHAFPFLHVAPARTFSSVNECIDEFYHEIETAKAAAQDAEQKAQLQKKLDTVKLEQQSQLERMQTAQTDLARKADALLENEELVKQVFAILNGALSANMDWKLLDHFVAAEQQRGSPQALAIHRLALDRNQVTLRLGDAPESVCVDVSLDQSVHAAVQQLHRQRKSIAEKEGRTRSAGDRAVRAATAKILASWEGKKRHRTITVRKTAWFERFRWFITREGILIVAGRDAQQNELLVRRYLGENDTLVHADVPDAPVVLVKGGAIAAVPPESLSQAGSFCLSLSHAWETKAVTSAWWAPAASVERSLSPDAAYFLRGRKNYLPPAQPGLGFGLMFSLGDDSVGRHAALTTRYQQLSIAVPEQPAEPAVAFPDTDLHKISRKEGSREQPKKEAPVKARRKPKKKLERYADQDDEERAVRMRLLGHKAPPVEQVAKPPPPETAQTLAPPQLETELPEVLSDLPALDDAERREVQALLADDEPAAAPDSEAIARLVGCPHSEDTLLHAVPVCAPYSALAGYVFRVKLLPGPLKRGKAAESARSYFIRIASPQHRALIEAIPEAEMVAAMAAKARVAVPAAEQAAKKSSLRK